jgi:uncharacterized membrane protein
MQSPSPVRDPFVFLRISGCLAIGLLFFMLCLVPFVLVDLATDALENLHLSAPVALAVLLGMLLGSFFNIPVARYPTDEEVSMPVLEPIGGWHLFPQYVRLRQEMIVSVNVGGCVIPVLLAVWLSRFIADGGSHVVAVTLAGMIANTLVCYRAARLVPRLGIALPFFVPALVALSITWIGLGMAGRGALEPYRAPVAFVSGITGPLVGADLLHWKDFQKIGAGQVSIGGAGTWDGIVITGLLAALLA